MNTKQQLKFKENKLVLGEKYSFVFYIEAQPKITNLTINKDLNTKNKL